MKYPNLFLNDLLAKEREKHPDLTVYIRYETPTNVASIKYYDDNGAALTVEFQKYNVAETFWYKDSNSEGKGKGIILQEIEFWDGRDSLNVIQNPDLVDGAILGNIDRKWYEICNEYAYDRKSLGIDYETCQQAEIAAKAFSIPINNFVYQGFSLRDCVHIATEAQHKNIPYEILFERKLTEAETKGIDVVKKETIDYLNSLNEKNNTYKERD